MDLIPQKSFFFLLERDNMYKNALFFLMAREADSFRQCSRQKMTEIDRYRQFPTVSQIGVKTNKRSDTCAAGATPGSDS
jgi:hypothetical protein